MSCAPSGAGDAIYCRAHDNRGEAAVVGASEIISRSIAIDWIGLYFFGKYLTLPIVLKSESCVHIMALNSCAVARMMLSAMGS